MGNSKSKVSESIFLQINLDNDTKLLMLSYLSLEDVLRTFENEIPVRDKILKIYKYQIPSLDDAIEDGNLSTVRYIVNQGCIVSLSSIILATRCGHLQIVKYFYDDFGYYSVNKKGISTDPIVMVTAIENNHLEIVKYLYKKGIKLQNALVYASIVGNLNIVKYFISKGYKIPKNIIDWIIERPDVCEEMERLEIVKFFVDEGYKPITITHYYTEEDNKEIREYLIKAGLLHTVEEITNLTERS